MAEEADFSLKKLFKSGKKLEKDQKARSVTKRVVYKDLDDHALFEYHMRHGRRGRAVIINNEEFHKETRRDGSANDRDELVRTLKYLGFKDDDITVRNNLLRAEMIALMEEVSGEDHSKSDCLFVAVLSHGDEGIICGKDTPVKIDELLHPFKEQRVKGLVGKPKIFLFQACRGHDADTGWEYESEARTADNKIHRISKESDIILCFSATKGRSAFRDPIDGSWFIQTVCDVLRKDGKKLEFKECLTRVNLLVSYYRETLGEKQSPCFTSTLTKSLYFP